MTMIAIKRFWIVSVLLVATVVFAADGKPADQVNPKTGLSYGFDLNSIDPKADPCTDFFQYSCGNWNAKSTIPADESSWGRFEELYDRNLATLRDILEAVKDPRPDRDAIQTKVGDYYYACMDEDSVERLGAAPLKPLLSRIDAMKSRDDIATAVASLHDVGIAALLRFTSDQDYKNAESVIAEVDQGGMGMPDRDYYLKDDADKKEVRAKYLAHVQKVMELLGDKSEAAAEEAKVVLAIETDLARVSQDRTFRRDPKNTYHKMSKDEFLRLSPGFRWAQYWKAMNAPGFTEVNVVPPDFVKGVEAAVDVHPLDHWKTYLRWKVASGRAPFLSKAFVQEDFEFNGKVLGGSQELRPRWKRCVDNTDNDLGEALGKLFVDKTFGADGKKRMMEMVANLESALDRDIKDLDWMGAETKIRAKEKLQAIANKIGYPDHYRDYSSVVVRRDDFFGNVQRGKGFEKHRVVNKIGKPVDHGEWGMSPPTVNAYYSSQMNDINFPAGILQPPYFDRTKDDAVNYGAIGMIIGHEITHGFDDQGRKFDLKGNLNDWWAPEDNTRFEKRAGCISDEYSQFVAVDDKHVRGDRTLGENTADNGGARIAYMALMEDLTEKAKTDPKVWDKIDGFTPQQRFFLGMGQGWCETVRPEYSRMLVDVDVHSPNEFRVKGTVKNMPEFQQAFGCKKGQAMVSDSACRVW